MLLVIEAVCPLTAVTLAAIDVVCPPTVEERAANVPPVAQSYRAEAVLLFPPLALEPHPEAVLVYPPLTLE